jgi:hypothetical protein
LVFDDEGHGVIKLHNKRVAYPSIIRFLNTFIGTASNEGHTGNDS